MTKSTRCSSEVPKFGSQHQPGNSQLPTNFKLPWHLLLSILDNKHNHGTQVCMQENNYINNIKSNLFKHFEVLWHCRCLPLTVLLFFLKTKIWFQTPSQQLTTPAPWDPVSFPDSHEHSCTHTIHSHIQVNINKYLNKTNYYIQNIVVIICHIKTSFENIIK